MPLLLLLLTRWSDGLCFAILVLGDCGLWLSLQVQQFLHEVCLAAGDAKSVKPCRAPSPFLIHHSKPAQVGFTCDTKTWPFPNVIPGAALWLLFMLGFTLTKHAS